MMNKIENPYRPIRAEITGVITETPTIKTIRVEPKEPIIFETGQFIELTIPGIGEAPFTPSSRPAIKDIMEITVMSVGKVTEKVHELKKGDIVGVRGPFGKGYPMDSFISKSFRLAQSSISLLYSNSWGVLQPPLKNNFLNSPLLSKNSYIKLLRGANPHPPPTTNISLPLKLSIG